MQIQETTNKQKIFCNATVSATAIVIHLTSIPNIRLPNTRVLSIWKQMMLSLYFARRRAGPLDGPLPLLLRRSDLGKIQIQLQNTTSFKLGS